MIHWKLFVLLLFGFVPAAETAWELNIAGTSSLATHARCMHTRPLPMRTPGDSCPDWMRALSLRCPWTIDVVLTCPQERQVINIQRLHLSYREHCGSFEYEECPLNLITFPSAMHECEGKAGRCKFSIGNTSKEFFCNYINTVNITFQCVSPSKVTTLCPAEDIALQAKGPIYAATPYFSLPVGMYSPGVHCQCRFYPTLNSTLTVERLYINLKDLDLLYFFGDDKSSNGTDLIPTQKAFTFRANESVVARFTAGPKISDHRGGWFRISTDGDVIGIECDARNISDEAAFANFTNYYNITTYAPTNSTATESMFETTKEDYSGNTTTMSPSLDNYTVFEGDVYPTLHFRCDDGINRPPILLKCPKEDQLIHIMDIYTKTYDTCLTQISRVCYWATNARDTIIRKCEGMRGQCEFNIHSLSEDCFDFNNIEILFYCIPPERVYSMCSPSLNITDIGGPIYLTSPNFNEVGGYYDSSLLCRCTVTPQNTSTIHAHVLFTDMEASEGCIKDYLNINDKMRLCILNINRMADYKVLNVQFPPRGSNISIEFSSNYTSRLMHRGFWIGVSSEPHQPFDLSCESMYDYRNQTTTEIAITTTADILPQNSTVIVVGGSEPTLHRRCVDESDNVTVTLLCPEEDQAIHFHRFELSLITNCTTQEQGDECLQYGESRSTIVRTCEGMRGQCKFTIQNLTDECEVPNQFLVVFQCIPAERIYSMCPPFPTELKNITDQLFLTSVTINPSGYGNTSIESYEPDMLCRCMVRPSPKAVIHAYLLYGSVTGTENCTGDWIQFGNSTDYRFCAPGEVTGNSTWMLDLTPTGKGQDVIIEFSSDSKSTYNESLLWFGLSSELQQGFDLYCQPVYTGNDTESLTTIDFFRSTTTVTPPVVFIGDLEKTEHRRCTDERDNPTIILKCPSDELVIHIWWIEMQRVSNCWDLILESCYPSGSPTAVIGRSCEGKRGQCEFVGYSSSEKCQPYNLLQVEFQCIPVQGIYSLCPSYPIKYSNVTANMSQPFYFTTPSFTLDPHYYYPANMWCQCTAHPASDALIHVHLLYGEIKERWLCNGDKLSFSNDTQYQFCTPFDEMSGFRWMGDFTPTRHKGQEVVITFRSDYMYDQMRGFWFALFSEPDVPFDIYCQKVYIGDDRANLTTANTFYAPGELTTPEVTTVINPLPGLVLTYMGSSSFVRHHKCSTTRVISYIILDCPSTSTVKPFLDITSMRLSTQSGCDENMEKCVYTQNERAPVGIKNCHGERATCMMFVGRQLNLFKDTNQTCYGFNQVTIRFRCTSEQPTKPSTTSTSTTTTSTSTTSVPTSLTTSTTPLTTTSLSSADVAFEGDEKLKSFSRCVDTSEVILSLICRDPMAPIHIQSLTVSQFYGCDTYRLVCSAKASSWLSGDLQHCEGRTGSCKVELKDMFRECSNPNQVNVAFQCVPPANSYPMCPDSVAKWTSVDNALYLVSPNFTVSGGFYPAYISCNCVASAGTHAKLHAQLLYVDILYQPNCTEHWLQFNNIPEKFCSSQIFTPKIVDFQPEEDVVMKFQASYYSPGNRGFWFKIFTEEQGATISLKCRNRYVGRDIYKEQSSTTTERSRITTTVPATFSDDHTNPLLTNVTGLYNASWEPNEWKSQQSISMIVGVSVGVVALLLIAGITITIYCIALRRGERDDNTGLLRGEMTNYPPHMSTGPLTNVGRPGHTHSSYSNIIADTSLNLPPAALPGDSASAYHPQSAYVAAGSLGVANAACNQASEPPLITPHTAQVNQAVHQYMDTGTHTSTADHSAPVSSEQPNGDPCSTATSGQMSQSNPTVEQQDLKLPVDNPTYGVASDLNIASDTQAEQ